MCCPIGCTELPNIQAYTSTARRQQTPLQARVNVSTRSGLTFQPQLIPIEIDTAEQAPLPSANGCEGYFNFTSRNTGVETPCPWTYQCDYNPQRIPAFFFHAHCVSATPQGSSGICVEVHYPVSYLTTESCDPFGDDKTTEWRLSTKVVPISCSLEVTV